MKTTYQPDQSWLHGKYSFKKDKYTTLDTGEINTKLPYIAVDINGKEFFAQGEDADSIISEIHNIWLKDGRRTTKTAFLRWINLYL